MSPLTDEQLCDVFECCSKLTSLTLGYCESITITGLMEGLKLSCGEQPAGSERSFNYLEIYGCRRLEEDHFKKLKEQMGSGTLVYVTGK